MNIKLFQICYAPEHFTNIKVPFEVWDNSENLTPKLCEFPIFNKVYDYATENNIDYWGVLSPKFEYKAGISGQQFYDWIEREITNSPAKPDVLFINPTPINESLSSSVISQGENCHPGLMNLMQRVLQRMNINLILATLWNYDTFALCNYFVGNKVFWTKYLNFANQFIAEASSDPNDYKMMFETGANYGLNSALPYYTFVLERLFSLFLIIYPEINHYEAKYSREQLFKKTKLPLEIVDEIRALSYIKHLGINDPELLRHWIFLRNKFAQQNPNIFNVE